MANHRIALEVKSATLVNRKGDFYVGGRNSKLIYNAYLSHMQKLNPTREIKRQLE